ncbi:MAG TPA: CARDB domain-containing protein [Caldilineaceae bacterium]|nr:CARDB domain-containing protein [Caldilineaceae bacterium]
MASLLLLMAALLSFWPESAAAQGAATACTPLPPFVSPHDRFGVNVIRDYGKEVTDYDVARTRAGWYLDYAAKYDPPTPGGLSYVQVLRVSDLQQRDWQLRVKGLVAANPGAIWMIGNEPDRDLQDGIAPDIYARIYHDTYTVIKHSDPLAAVGPAAVIQATPIRLRYLDAFVQSYEARFGVKPPVDFWNVHNFILREDPHSWGAGIPPGMMPYADEGMRFEVWDHGDFELFKAQIIEFRRWMARHGYRDVALIVSEYGILMPPDYFAEADGSVRYDYNFVRDFMLASFDFFLEHTDPQLGHPQDGNRLVQSWAWYSLNDYFYQHASGGFKLYVPSVRAGQVGDAALAVMQAPAQPVPNQPRGSNGSLFDHDKGTLLRFGEDFANYIEPFYRLYTDSAVRSLEVSPARVAEPDEPGAITIQVRVHNRGNADAHSLTVRLWWDRSPLGRTLIGEQTLPALAARCSQQELLTFTWTPGPLAMGMQTLSAEIITHGALGDAAEENNGLSKVLWVGELDQMVQTRIPLVQR